MTSDTLEPAGLADETLRSDATTQYLAAIGRAPLLTAEQELNFAQQLDDAEAL